MKTNILFSDLGLSASTLEALSKKGFLQPTPIQAAVIPILLKGEQDIIGQAQTGTGKTAAFGLPIIEKIDPHLKSVQALILAPTRELALQVEGELRSLRGNKQLNILAVYGGQGMREQLQALKAGVQIVVGTPGRIIDHLTRKSLRLNDLTHLVLDEADEMLNMGFIDDVEMILKATPADKRVLLFSATMPPRLATIADKYMHQKKLIQAKRDEAAVPLTEQIYFEVRPNDRLEALCRVINMEPNFYGVIFCRTQVDTDQVAEALIKRGYAAAAIHGGIEQRKREAILDKFRMRKTTILVATDVAARGIDINDLTHVVNYALPSSPEVYTHRIGRTGRAGKKGVAITFIAPSERRKIEFIQHITKLSIRRATLPTANEIAKIKFSQLQLKIDKILHTKMPNHYEDIAKQLLQKHEPLQIIAALLKLSHADDLDIAAYKDLSVAETPSKTHEGTREKRRFGGGAKRDFHAKDKRPGKDFKAKRFKKREY